jgi:hypothetical protein
MGKQETLREGSEQREGSLMDIRVVPFLVDLKTEG